MTSWDQCFAHSLPDNKDCSQWQTLKAHAEGVAALSRDFAIPFHSEQAAELIGQVHDAGKCDPRFQAYLRGEGPGCSHASVGAKWLDVHVPVLGRLLAYTVDGHHAGLPDGAGGDTALVSHLEGAKESPEAAIAPPADVSSLVPSFMRAAGNLKAWLWVKMLYSCLVDADFLDTERFMDSKRAAQRPETFDDFQTLWARYADYMAKRFGDAPDTPVNRQREAVRAAALAKAAGAPGLYSLTVPTGGGKTLASLGFALKHAQAHGLRKVIYAIPYSTIIEQTTETLAGVLGGHNVLEHHAEAKWREDKDEIANPLRQLTENWAGVPVVVTTNVQFFESFYSAHSSRCRKLHNVAKSVIVLDEAQKLPEQFLAPCAELLRRLMEDYGCTVLLCTATQPDLSAFGLKDVTEITPDVDELYDALRRVDYHALGRMEWDALAKRVVEEPNALCVVNTRKDARDLFAAVAELRDAEAVFHLSTWMCPAHRRDTIRIIRQRLKDKLPTYVVSTSLIEAGVDLDFPAVFRALAGLDSLAQVAGRCNREGLLERGRVYLFEEPEPCAIGALKKGVFVTEHLIGEELCESPHRPANFATYFREYYNALNGRGETILEWLHNLKNLRFRTVDEAFHMIPNEGEVTVFVPYGEAKEILRTACENGLTKARLRALRGARVQVRQRVFNQLEPMLVPLNVFDKRTGVELRSPYYALPDLKGFYSEQTGLDTEFAILDEKDLIDN